MNSLTLLALSRNTETCLQSM